MSTTLNYDIGRAIRSLPGYDPFAQAGDRYEFVEGLATDAIEFVESCCTFVEGPKGGEPFLLETWQKGIIGNIWGWREKGTGLRRFREVFVFIPRGNGKTELAAVFVCLFLYLDAEKGARLYSSAAEADQARLCFDRVAGMVRNEPLMAERTEIYKFSMVVGDKSYKYLSAVAGTKHGFNVQLLVNDELHAHKTPELTEVLMTGMGKRLNPLAVHITTSDYEREGSICNQKHNYAGKVRDGVINDPAFLPVIYEASKDDDWTDPVVWRKANPNFGISVPEDYMARECTRAKDDPAFENTFKRLHLNIRTEALDRWITTDKWDACRDQVNIDDIAGVPCWCGLDLASSQDFNAFVVAAPVGDQMHVFPFFWVPQETAAKRERERRIPYSVWSADNILTLTPGDVTDPDTIYRDIIGIIDRYRLNVREIAVDRAFQGLDLIQKLTKEGFLAFAHGQGSLGMIPPTKVTKDLILSGRLKHNGHAVLRWMMSNVVVHPGEGKEYPMKDKSADKIDGVVAMVMAVGRAAMEPQPQASFYESETVEFV
jgi:phage terminase large subunit-like protein